MASADYRRAQKDDRSHKSTIYPRGSEFVLCNAESQLMGAVVGVLNESLTESIKGFYKLRKAYVSLDGILEAESRYMRSKTGLGTPWMRSTESFRSSTSTKSAQGMPGGFSDGNARDIHSRSSSVRSKKSLNAEAVAQARAVCKTENSNAEDDDEAEFYDADEAHDTTAETDKYTGHIELNGVTVNPDGVALDDNVAGLEHPHIPETPSAGQGMLDDNPDSDVFMNPIDAFVHSGANLCFGLLLVMIAMIPPAFGKLLFIIGFRGDRDRGLRMLWQASKFRNINGAFAGLILLGYYHGVVGFSDIIPDATMSADGEPPTEGYPKERCEMLLADMRSRHPKSQLWLLEQARMEATNRRLKTAIALLSNSKPSPLKQVEAIEMFEKSLNAMYIHDYELCATSFIACVTLNNWSHALYYYIAGAALVELYRHNKSSNPTVAAAHAKKATEYLRTAPDHAGKKKFMARQLPFDIFVTRKVKKWEARAHEFHVPFIDAIGVSPLEEMVFFWNGYKRMDTAQLNDSLAALAWSEDKTLNPTWAREGPDEHAILAVLRGATLRNLHRWDEAKATLKTGVLDLDRAELKGGLKDDWTAPAAYYERGVISWMQRVEVAERVQQYSGGKGATDEELKYVEECEAWTDKAAKWESYELDARIGLKIATAQDTLRKWRKAKG